MSARRRTRGGKVFVDSTPKQQTQDFTEEPAEGQGFDLPPSRKPSRAANDGISASTQIAVDPRALLSRVLLRRIFFLNNEKSRYVSIGFYPAHDYQIFVEFGAPRIAPITITE
jgi:hypothetical protein